MKPVLHFDHDSNRKYGRNRRFPVTDFNFQSIELRGHNACCADATGNSFRAAREYFNNEAARDFLTEAAVFVAMMVTIAAPLLNGVQSIVDLLRATI